MKYKKRLSFFLVIIALWGCTKKAADIVTPQTVASSNNAPAIHLNDSVTYLALGDSYTYGVGLPVDQSYPYQLAAQLKAENYLPHDPAVVAFQGWTAADLLNGLATANIQQKFDIVTILIGVNDQNKGVNPDTYAARLDQLIADATAYANGYSSRVFVLSIPDWSVTPFAANMDKANIKAGITAFNAIIQAETNKLHANYIDITTLSEQAAADPSLTGSDGLHPSAAGYALWVGQLSPMVVRSFGNP